MTAIDPFSLQKVFDKPDSFPSFGDVTLGEKISLVGAYLTAAAAKNADDCITLGGRIAREIGGIDQLNIPAAFQDFVETSFGSLFIEYTALEERVLESVATPAERLKCMVVGAAITFQERDPSTRQMRSAASLNCGW